MSVKNTRFGEFGGQYVPEVLMNALIQLEKGYEEIKNDSDFIGEYNFYLK
jgi:tryptophan synthase beta chain